MSRLEGGILVQQFLHILLQPDNIPIAGMLLLILFFLGMALTQAFRNDRLIQEGREDEVYDQMAR